MTEEEKKALTECSVKGLLKQLRSNDVRNVEQLLTTASMYIARHNLDPEATKCTLEELIHVTKDELGRMIVQNQKDVGESDLTEMHAGENDQLAQWYFTNPVQMTAVVLKEAAKNIDVPEGDGNDPEMADYFRRAKANIGTVANRLDTFAEFRNLFYLERDNKAFDVLTYLDYKLADDSSIEQEFTKQKPGFFEKMFNRTSEEYHNFKGAFANFKNPGHPLYGDKKTLEGAAMGYLRHKFPNLQEGELPTPEQIASLGGAGKNRADFCLKVVESCREAQALRNEVDPMVNAVQNLDLKLPKPGVDEEQAKFQQQIAKDIASEENEINNEIENEEVKELEIDNNLENNN